MSEGLRIAILAHSTNPRGGVVHAVELGEALARAGHRAVVHAPDARGLGFFRRARCELRPIPARPAGAGLLGLVEARIGDYLRHFSAPDARAFDVFHAQDGISGNALATLSKRGQVPAYLRTVHHVEHFADSRVQTLEERSIVSADRVLAVSRRGAAEVRQTYGRDAAIVGNGVDRERFQAAKGEHDERLRASLGLGDGPVILAVGGVERRKNTLVILAAFRRIRDAHPAAQLVIAGGASLLDHHDYRTCFNAALAESGLGPEAVIVTGPVVDADVPALYRLADILLFPSLQEGFGLVVLEAMASRLPVVVSRIEPFTEYLGEADAQWCDPEDAGSVAAAALAALAPARAAALAGRGAAIAEAHAWDAVAARHLCAYAAMRETSLA